MVSNKTLNMKENQPMFIEIAAVANSIQRKSTQAVVDYKQ